VRGRYWAYWSWSIWHIPECVYGFPGIFVRRRIFVHWRPLVTLLQHHVLVGVPVEVANESGLGAVGSPPPEMESGFFVPGGHKKAPI